MRRVTIAIPEDAFERLRRLAGQEFRDPKGQAARLLVDAIEQAVRADGVTSQRQSAEVGQR